MQHQEGFFNNRQGDQIYYQFWLPEGSIKCILLIVHGLNEHSGRYRHMAEFFTERGMAVYGLDFPGHGRSAGVRSYVESSEILLTTLEDYLEMIQNWQPEVPVYLVGHSMGGLFASLFLLDHQQLIQGAVISGALVKVPEYVSELTVRVGRLLSRLLPKFRIVPIDIESISRDPAVVEAYIGDPLVFTGKTTVRLSNEINDGINRLEEEGAGIKVPVLLLHGGADRICDPSWSKYLYDLISSPDKVLKIYDGFYHEIYNEPEHLGVFEDVFSWLDERLP